ncbi:MAG TPA: hypothetical protein VGO98_02930 [Candidatus Saccharimonadales bacterium]|jgi:hypothetical protein|nr:hypothetical protein [Candidatus Saccharimonadales bacterium]
MESQLEAVISHPQERYFSLPKTLGQVPSDELLAIAEELSDNQASTNARTRVLHSSIISSAIIEAILTTEDSSHDYDDEHIEGIDIAERHLQMAYEAKYNLIQDGLDPPSNFVDLLRMSLRLKFMRVYKDIVCGEITDETLSEIRESLTKEILSYDRHLAYEYDESSTRRQLSGLKGEAAVLSKYWGDYPNNSRLIAIPAMLRGDDGNKRPDETHDLILLEETVPGSFTYARSIEVKSGKVAQRKVALLTRYANPILHINLRTNKIKEIHRSTRLSQKNSYGR